MASDMIPGMITFCDKSVNSSALRGRNWISWSWPFPLLLSFSPSPSSVFERIKTVNVADYSHCYLWCRITSLNVQHLRCRHRTPKMLGPIYHKKCETNKWSLLRNTLVHLYFHSLYLYFYPNGAPRSPCLCLGSLFVAAATLSLPLSTSMLSGKLINKVHGSTLCTFFPTSLCATVV